MRVAMMAVVLMLMGGCKDQPGQEVLPDPVQGQVKDGGLGREQRDAGADGRGREVPAGVTADLAGTWRGELDHERYGKVRGDVVIDADGNVSYTVMGEGVTHSGVFRVLEWTGDRLKVKDQGPAGGEYTVQATLSGPRLELRFEPVGKVVLVRADAKPLGTK